MDIETPVVSVEIDPPKKHRFHFNPKITAGVVVGLIATTAAALTVKAKKSDGTFSDEEELNREDPFAPLTHQE